MSIIFGSVAYMTEVQKEEDMSIKLIKTPRELGVIAAQLGRPALDNPYFHQDAHPIEVMDSWSKAFDEWGQGWLDEACRLSEEKYANEDEEDDA